VNDVTQAEQLSVLLKRLLGLADGARHTEAKPTSRIYLDNHSDFKQLTGPEITEFQNNVVPLFRNDVIPLSRNNEFP
jgi:hypothetical protein